MPETSASSSSNTPEDDSLAVPVGGNALNPQGETTRNPDKLGAGGEVDADTEGAEVDADAEGAASGTDD
ncbi:hypothetical protein B0I08_104157 [Glaciihabitans tibetensis]|uniref:Uncharacterized protein n=1 Tax=Glaciihabitans tibetensis TaxID=1266600 RepID=A0A2T0VE59_9MICO|nr:hypothetical protein [Glaciihabitans tibetensis]PRY68455.1 hypothetical protein B0I08_104157 [Glaciihabitans tibetensis]